MNEQTLTEQLTASTENVLDKVLAWVDGAIAMLPNLAVAVLVVLAFAFIAKLARRVIHRALGRIAANKQIVNLISSIAYIAVILIGAFIALGVLNLEKTVTSLLAGVGILGLALGFAFQDIAANFVSGIFLAIRTPIKQGDIVDTVGVMGVVEQINLRTTLIRTFQGQLVYVPNRKVFDDTITNYSDRSERRIDIAVGVAYDDDLDLAERTAQEALEDLPMRKTSKPVQVFFTEFGGSSIDMTLRFWIDFKHDQSQFFDAQSTAIKAIKKAFDDAGLNIPFPIRTLDFGPLAAPVEQALKRDA